MVVRALWRSEARRVVPWLLALAYGSSRVSDQGTNMCATILNPFIQHPQPIIKRPNLPDLTIAALLNSNTTSTIPSLNTVTKFPTQFCYSCYRSGFLM